MVVGWVITILNPTYGEVTFSRINFLEVVLVVLTPISIIESPVDRSVPTTWLKSGVTVCQVIRSEEI